MQSGMAQETARCVTIGSAQVEDIAGSDAGRRPSGVAGALSRDADSVRTKRVIRILQNSREYKAGTRLRLFST
jgi:hypothetical protein